MGVVSQKIPPRKKNPPFQNPRSAPELYSDLFCQVSPEPYSPMRPDFGEKLAQLLLIPSICINHTETESRCHLILVS